MEEDHSTPSSHTLLHMAAGLLPMAAAPLSLFFSSLHVLTHSHFSHLCSQIIASFIGKHGDLSPAHEGDNGPEIMPLIVALVMLPLSHN